MFSNSSRLFTFLLLACVVGLRLVLRIISMLNCILTFTLYSICLVGSFGNGVLSYFTFLKWLLQLNIYIFILTLCFVIIPQSVSTGEELPLESPQNFSDRPIINASNSSNSVSSTSKSAFLSRQRRNILPMNYTEEEDNDKQCNLVKPANYSLYTQKPIAQLLVDFISGVVSTPYQHLKSPYNNNT